MMEAYKGFAVLYDRFMEDVDYDGWVAYLQDIFRQEKKKPALIADLGCGTGNITNRLAKAGYDVIGIDLSEEMLGVAQEKAQEGGLSVLYLCQDMREFELYGTVDCIISLCDSLNYILEEEELLTVFQLVNNYLHPGGLFIFDMNTEHKFQTVLADKTFAVTEEDAAYIWENYYDPTEKINEYYMNFFARKGNSENYERFEEVHMERAYSIETVTCILEKSGLKLKAIYDAYTFQPPRADSERIYIVAEEIMKKAAEKGEV